MVLVSHNSQTWKNIHKHEEHTLRKLIQIKSSNTIKIQ